MYTRDKSHKTIENEICKKDPWELVSKIDIAYTFYVPTNNLAVWEQEWKYHADNESLVMKITLNSIYAKND